MEVLGARRFPLRRRALHVLGRDRHPGIGAIDTLGRTFATAPANLLEDAAIRHHCYELHIGTSHLGWYVWTGDDHWLRLDAAHLEMLLERGPVT